MSLGRVLVVDDHAGFRATARRLLEAQGWLVVGEAADGTAAISAATVLRPDVVLLDIGLPDVDGFEVAERLASADRQVVLTSSRDRSAYAGRIARSAAVGFIAKSDLGDDGLRVLVGPVRAR